MWWDAAAVSGWWEHVVTAVLQASIDRDPPDQIVLVTLHSEQDGAHFHDTDCWCQPLVLKLPSPAAA